MSDTNISSPSIDDCGPNVGLPIPCGKASFTVESFSVTICRARYTSAPQLNSTQTTEKPFVDDDLTRRTSVAPFTAVSIGNVTSRSTSSAAMPFASVITTTVGALRSGKTSTSMLSAVYRPPMVSNTPSMSTTRRLSSENLIILFNMACDVNGCDYVLQE